jgi:hypothetical protein
VDHPTQRRKAPDVSRTLAIIESLSKPENLTREAEPA